MDEQDGKNERGKFEENQDFPETKQRGRNEDDGDTTSNRTTKVDGALNKQRKDSKQNSEAEKQVGARTKKSTFYNTKYHRRNVSSDRRKHHSDYQSDLRLVAQHGLDYTLKSQQGASLASNKHCLSVNSDRKEGNPDDEEHSQGDSVLKPNRTDRNLQEDNGKMMTLNDQKLAKNKDKFRRRHDGKEAPNKQYANPKHNDRRNSSRPTSTDSTTHDNKSQQHENGQKENENKREYEHINKDHNEKSRCDTIYRRRNVSSDRKKHHSDYQSDLKLMAQNVLDTLKSQQCASLANSKQNLIKSSDRKEGNLENMEHYQGDSVLKPDQTDCSLKEDNGKTMTSNDQKLAKNSKDKFRRRHGSKQAPNEIYANHKHNDRRNSSRRMSTEFTTNDNESKQYENDQEENENKRENEQISNYVNEKSRSETIYRRRNVSSDTEMHHSDYQTDLKLVAQNVLDILKSQQSASFASGKQDLSETSDRKEGNRENSQGDTVVKPDKTDHNLKEDNGKTMTPNDRKVVKHDKDKFRRRHDSKEPPNEKYANRKHNDRRNSDRLRSTESTTRDNESKQYENGRKGKENRRKNDNINNDLNEKSKRNNRDMQENNHEQNMDKKSDQKICESKANDDNNKKTRSNESVQRHENIERKNEEATQKEGNLQNKETQKTPVERARKNKIRKPKAKVTKLYIVVGENGRCEEYDKLKMFLLHRMGNPKALDFEVIPSEGDNTLVTTIRFESLNKASVARQLLNASNRNAVEKVHCFLKFEEAKGKVVNISEKRKVDLEKCAREILETCEVVVNAHNDKLNEIRDKIVETSNKLSKRKGVSFYEFEKITNEKLALEDKLDELVSQKKEFTRYIQSMMEKLKQISDEKYTNKLRDIRTAFGVECRRLGTALPMYARREDILNLVKGNQVCVILGETGSGKSTQMVQYLYQAGFAENGLIACTQPRKIAAISLATHVSSELGTSVGHVIGYQVGMQTKMNAETKVVFMTDHILLNECLKDRLLTKYSCILIDEAHERSISTDLLLGMLKEALSNRPAMKAIITSATIDPKIFVDYFGGNDKCPVLKVSGRTFPVEVIYDQDDMYDSPFPEDYEMKALNKTIEIHKSTPVEQGDILVFLTSGVETEKCVDRMKQRCGERDVWCLQLHGRLKPEEQQFVFQPTPRGKRKVVFATNSAETSITIPGIKFVVDTGVVKEMKFDPKKNMNCLNVVDISQSSANQRKGRAGRMASGICYRLYTETNYNRMAKTSTPELLRIQVSQALLKLLALGVDPMSFDYVQSPTQESMKSAMVELTDIGAVENLTITELGKWIARLPVEPMLGVMIKKGLDMDIAIESLVVASCCNQSGIFFRVGNEEEKKTSDMKKMKFCHIGGDLLTMLNVYREWDQVQEKAKGKWCQSNSINGKAMKGVRDMVNEISSTLKKELDLKFRHEFRKPEEADELVQNLVFECMSANLGFYLGHEAAGYLIVKHNQRVKLHPSSAILSMGFQPGWVVFNRVLRTSADFMTEVTPVNEILIKEAVEKGKLSVSIDSLQSKKVTRVLKIPVGKHVFWKFVGPRYSNKLSIEEEISRTCDNSLVIVEAHKQRGEVCLYTQPMYADHAQTMLRSAMENLPEQLLNESREECLGNENSGIRVLLREGGSAVDVLMPHQFRSLNIKQTENAQNDLDEETARHILEYYGPVDQIWQATGRKQYNSPFWGTVTFTHESDAVVAAEDVNDDENSELRLIPIFPGGRKSNSQQDFTIKLSWCRRPCLGHCYVYANRPEDIPLLLDKRPVINGAECVISRPKKQSDLFIKGLVPTVNVDDIKVGLARELGISFEMCQERFRIVIPRVKVETTSDTNHSTKMQLSLLVDQYSELDRFRVIVREIKPNTVMCSANVVFSDPKECHSTGRAMMEDDLRIGSHKIEVSLECKSTVHVNKRLFQIIGEDITRLAEDYKQRNSTTSIQIRELKSGHFSVDVRAQNLQKLARVKVKVDKVVGGDELECGEKANLHVLFSKDGRQKAQQIEKSTQTLISVDERRMKVSIQGLERNRQRALSMVEDYITKHVDALETEVRLKGDDNPPGLTKALLLKYGLKFQGLKEETGVSVIQLNLRFHEIAVSGKDDALKKAIEKIRALREEIIKRDKATVLKLDLPDCPICLCPVEESDICRLEYCGHAYCKVCLSSLIQDAVSAKTLPVKCAAENCDRPLVIRDINSQIKLGTIKRKALLYSALDCLVTKHSDRFKYCITPNCEAVYRVTTTGQEFNCPLCVTRICTTCDLQFHEGLTCAMYQSAKKDGDSVLKWIKEDPIKRKLCPKCGFGIEKIDGCDHMTCKCGAHICWKCLKYFSSGSQCYGHMNTAHGSFV